MAIRLLIADDHMVVRAGLKRLLNIDLVAEATCGDEAVRLADEIQPDVVLLDVRMPHGDGLAALARIKIDHSNMPVLMYSGFDCPAHAARAVALGASGLLHKGSGSHTIVETIQSAARGEALWTSVELRRAASALAAPTPMADGVPLTHREHEVLQRIVAGGTNVRIADQLGISDETVKEHVQHILRKIGVSNRTQAAIWAVRAGLA